MVDVQHEANPPTLLFRTASKHHVGYVPDHLANELHNAGADLAVCHRHPCFTACFWDLLDQRTRRHRAQPMGTVEFPCEMGAPDRVALP
jgi:hypothetical protein